MAYRVGFTFSGEVTYGAAAPGAVPAVRAAGRSPDLILTFHIRSDGRDSTVTLRPGDFAVRRFAVIFLYT